MPESTTRGMPFDPRKASAQRIAREAKRRSGNIADRKAHAVMLDQIATCYRQYTPPQLRHAS